MKTQQCKKYIKSLNYNTWYSFNHVPGELFRPFWLYYVDKFSFTLYVNRYITCRIEVDEEYQFFMLVMK